jgi:hypothetical protein
MPHDAHPTFVARNEVDLMTVSPRHFAACLALCLLAAPFTPGCDGPAQTNNELTPRAVTDEPEPGPPAVDSTGAPAAPSAPEDPKPDELPAEIVATQDAIRARLIELVDDPSTDAFADSDTIVAEFPDVEFEILMVAEGSRSVRVKIKGGEEFYVLPRHQRKQP